MTEREPVHVQHADQCRAPACRGSIIWITTKAGKAMPVDALPHPDGTIRLTYDEAARRYRGEHLHGLDLEAARQDPEQDGLYLAHRASCKDPGWVDRARAQRTSRRPQRGGRNPYNDRYPRAGKRY